MNILRIARLRLPSVAFCAGIICVAGCGGGSVAPTAPVPAPARDSSATAFLTSFTFTTLDDESDPTFNQLLGINNSGEITGYFGSGAAGHPNKGYTLAPPYGQANYANENFPGSVQTQVTGINSLGYTCGFWVNSKGTNRGFVEWGGVFTSYRDPKTTGLVNQILGLNDSGLAVGFYTDSKGINHAYKIQQGTTAFVPIVPPGGKNAVATAVNKNGTIVGFYTVGTATVGFLDKGGVFTTFDFPGSANTQPLGINIHNQVVGLYFDSNNLQHGFLLRAPLSHATFQSIDDPNGIGSTAVNGLNDNLDLVGFYTDAAGNTDGMLAHP